ncbi:hypothetical protein [Allobranchiibius sp. GilTou38]|uniref:hypothetical protein n=1 Tax=Allobranchiibius sp. GilTou38 TaxID=2815210 RepID=UPI001AA15AA0|nr:hypothetical protein [Allobranchiibius sp. GilTou38]MBO1765478.1 hypothetical protein [Allobranchiibius sp. GilTou38]
MDRLGPLTASDVECGAEPVQMRCELLCDQVLRDGVAQPAESLDPDSLDLTERRHRSSVLGPSDTARLDG